MSRKKISTLDKEWEQENGRKISNPYNNDGRKSIAQLDAEWENTHNKLLMTAGEAYDRQSRQTADQNRNRFVSNVNRNVQNYVNARENGEMSTLQTVPYADRARQYGNTKSRSISSNLTSTLSEIANNRQNYSNAIDRRASEVKGYIPKNNYEDIYNTVENRLKERRIGEKIEDFARGTGVLKGANTFAATLEKVNSKEKQIMDILQEEYGMSEREAQNIAENWGDVEAAENVGKSDEWYAERQRIYNQMSDEEKNLLADTYKRGTSSNPNSALPGKKQLQDLGYDAEEMYEFYRRKVAREENEEMISSVENAGTLKNVGQNTIAVGRTLTQPLDLIDQVYSSVSGVPYDTSLAKNTNYKNTVRNETSRRIVEGTGSQLLGKGYGIATSMADSAASIATGPAALPIMAMDAGVNAYVDAIDRGAGEGKAAWTALAYGGFEALFEKVSLDHLWAMAKPTAKAGLKSSVINVLAQMGIEGSEEVATSIADTVADRVINGNQSEYQSNVRSYMESGMEESEARRNAAVDFAKSLAEDFIGGAISGGVFGTVAETVGTHRYRKIAKSLSNESTEKLYNAAVEAPEGTTANEIVSNKKMEELTENDKINVMKSLAELSESEPTVKDILENALMEEGVSKKDASKQADQLIEMLKQGEEVSEEEQKKNENILSNHDAQARVYGNFLSGKYNEQYEGKTSATDAMRSAQEDFLAPKMEKKSVRTAEKVSKDTGISVVRANLKETDTPTAIVGFSDATEDATLLRSYDSKNGAKAVAIQDVILPDDVKSIYYNASSLKDTYAANAAVENYKGEAPTLYNLGVTTAYYTGRSGIFSFDEFKNNPKNRTIFSGVGEDTLLQMYYLGQNAEKREQKNKRGVSAAGKPVEERKGTTKGNFGGIDKAVQLHAKKTGLDIESKKETEHRANGYFAPSMMKIVLREDANIYQTLMHETNEFADSFNPEGMEKVYDSVIEFMGTERGASYLSQMGRDYLDRYRSVNKDETYREALEELSNDVIGAMFSTDEGIHEYMDWLNNDSGMNVTERKSIIQSILDFFQDLFNSIKDYVDNHNLARNTERIMESSEEKLSHIRKQILKEWDAAIENSKGKVAPVQQEGKRFSLGESGRQFEDEKLYKFIEDTSNGNVGNWEHFTISETLSERLIKDIKEVVGIDVSGYKNEIVPGDIRHIINRHGKEGDADQSMKDNHDIAKIPYVIRTYDYIMKGKLAKGKRNADGKWAKTIVLQKKIDDYFMYVVEAVPDNSKKTLYVISAFINKNDTYSREHNALGPVQNVQNDAESDVSSIDSIPRNDGNATKYSLPDLIKNTTKDGDIRYSLSIDEAWEEVMNGMDNEFVDSSVDFAKGAKYSDLPSILMEGYASLKNVTVNKKEIDAMARNMIRKYKSTYDVDRFSANLERVFAFMKENKDLQFSDLYRVMKEVAEPMISKSQSYDPAEQEVYKKFLETFKGQTFKVSEEQARYLESMYGESFSKIAFRFNSRVKLSKTNGVDLDSVYEQLMEDSGYTLDLATPEEEAFFITEAIEGLRPQPKLMNGMNTVEQSYDVALDIFNDFFESQAMDSANAAVKKHIAELKRKQKLIQEKNELRYKEQLNAIKKQEFERRAKQAEYYQEKLEEAGRSKTAAINAKDRAAAEKYQKLEESYRKKYNTLKEKHSDTIDRLLAKNRITAHTIRENQERAMVKEQIKKNAGSIITYFNQNTDKKHIPEALKEPIANFITSIDYTGTSESKEAQEWENNLRKLKGMLQDRDEAVANGIEDIYDEINVYSKDGNDVLKDMESFLNHFSGSSLSEISTSNLKVLNKLLRSLRSTITNTNKLFVNNRTQNAKDLGRETIRELEGKKEKKSHSGIVDGALSIVDAGMMDARSYFYRLGNAGMSIYDEFREAFNERVWKLKEAQEYMQKSTEGIDVRKWTGDKAEIHTFVINGKELKLTTGQVMTIYELRKRGQAMIHMLNGGIKPTKIGNGHNAIERRKALNNLTEFDIDNITSVLTPEQKKVADAMQQFMNDQCKRWGNENTMKLYGYERYNAKNYFPIRVDRNTVDTKDDTQFFSTPNKGFTKKTVEGASNPLIVGDIFDVFTKHVTEMATYSTFSAPILDAMKWFNFRDMDYSGDIAKNNGSVKEEIESVYGNDYLKFFEKLMKDINAESNYDFTNKVQNKLVGNMKAASVGANIRVAIQQPTAIVRAMAVMNPKYLAEGIVSNPVENVRKANEYSAIAQWKSWGYFETSLGKSMKGIITGDASLKEKITEKSMILAQMGDNITWGYLWQACEREIQDKRPDLKYDSEEFRKAVAKRFDDVIDQTQVVDTVLHRSHIMRNQNGVIQMVTAFMAEPTKSYNLLMNAARDIYEKRPGAGQKMARAAVAFTLTSFVNAMAQAIIDAMRDDDDDKKFGEKFLEFWKENFKENMNIFSMIPYVKDILSIRKGYDVSRTDMQGISYLINGAEQLYKWITNPTDSSGYTYREKHTFYQSFKKVLQGTSQLIGVPIYNLIRDTGAFYHTITGDTFGGSVKKRTDRYETIAQAYIADNSEIMEEEMNKLLDFGVSEETIQKGVKTQMKSMLQDEEISVEQYEDFLQDEYEMDEDEAYFETIHAMYSSQSDMAAVHNAITVTLEKDTTENRKMIVSQVQDAMDHGKTKDKVLSSLRSKYKDQYLELKAQGKAADLQNLLIVALMSAGYTKNEAMKKINSWE